MNEKEIAEIRRRFRPDKNNITSVRGCFVNEKREIVSEIDQSVALLPQEESEKMFAVLKRALSGTPGKNLIDITFSTAQVAESEEHGLLMALRGSELEDAQAVQRFYQKVIDTVNIEGNYLILLAYDRYDVPFRSKDGERQDDASSEVFSYLLCAICPVKVTKPALGYFIYENVFRNCKTDWLVGAPELGFLFPAFDDRSANIYNALYYTRDTAESQQAFTDEVFRTPLPMPAAVQRETFEEILEETLAEECSYGVVQAVQGQLCEMILEHKVNKVPEPLNISKETFSQVLETCGIDAERTAAFGERFDEAFGEDAQMNPRNLVDPKQMQVCTPDVTIRVNPERSNLVQTRVIDGTKYILIRADENVEVNGVNVQIS